MAENKPYFDLETIEKSPYALKIRGQIQNAKDMARPKITVFSGAYAVCSAECTEEAVRAYIDKYWDKIF